MVEFGRISPAGEEDVVMENVLPPSKLPYCGFAALLLPS
jgi:hypothetical protein